jgi:transcription factor C subunit 7
VDYKPTIVPAVVGETIDELHDRVAYALHKIIERSDQEGVKVILICTHAASLIAIGRALTGVMPAEVEAEDFHPFTCGLSTFTRKSHAVGSIDPVLEWEGVEAAIPVVKWRDGAGVGGGWDCVVSGDCSFLPGGEERGW